MGGTGNGIRDAAQAARELAELADRLRLFRSGPGGAPPAGVARLAVGARLLIRLSAETGHGDTARLGEAAQALARSVEQAPAAVDENLLDLVSNLAGLLEQCLAAADDGTPAGEFLERQDWSLLGALEFGTGGHDAGRRPALLVVASRFRRDAVRDKLAGAGVPCEQLDDPRSVAVRLEREPAPRWIICDDQEPERRLAALCGILDARGGARPPVILLVAGAAAGEKSAARPGADSIWIEPFDPADLPQ